MPVRIRKCLFKLVFLQSQRRSKSLAFGSKLRRKMFALVIAPEWALKFCVKSQGRNRSNYLPSWHLRFWKLTGMGTHGTLLWPKEELHVDAWLAIEFLFQRRQFSTSSKGNRHRSPPAIVICIHLKWVTMKVFSIGNFYEWWNVCPKSPGRSNQLQTRHWINAYKDVTRKLRTRPRMRCSVGQF